MKKSIYVSGLFLLFSLGCNVTVANGNHTPPSYTDVESQVKRVVSWQIDNFHYSASGNLHDNGIASWAHSVLYIGLSEWATLREEESAAYWEWLSGIGTQSNWKMNGIYPYHADEFCIGQFFATMYGKRKQDKMIAGTLERMERVERPAEDEVHLFPGNIEPLVLGSKWVFEAEHLKIGYDRPLLEISLRNHRNLSELTLIQPEKLCHRLCHFRNLRHRLPFIRKNQLRIRFFHRHSLSTVFRPQIFRISLYRIILSLIRKGKLDKGTHFRFCILASEHGCLPDSSACLPVQCKCNPIKDRGFSCTRISCHQKKPLTAKLRKINHHLIRIRTKCR